LAATTVFSFLEKEIFNMRIAIRGMGIVGGFGCGIDELKQTLATGDVSPKNMPVGAKSGDAEMPVYLCDTSRLEDFVNKRALRRIDHFSQLAVLGSYLALEDAGLLEKEHQNLAVVVATGYGAARTTFSFLDSVFDDGDALASPTRFSNSVHNAAAAHISIILKARGPNLTVSQFEMSVPSAMLAACQWLEDNIVDAVLLGGVDEYCGVAGYCWKRFFGSHSEFRAQPLKWESQSAIIGEGAAFFLLTGDEGQTPSYGFITDIQLGNIGANEPVLAKDAFLIIGADGQKSSGKYYDDCIAEDTQAAVYTQLYGSFPAGFAFDLAIAALSIREGKIFATPSDSGDNDHLQIIRAMQPLDSKAISCLKFGCEGEFGVITLAGK
jgi:3-oxoacyl-[acyl-carrier-protein] synthase II